MADPYYDEPYLYDGKEDKAVRIDYSVLSVGVMTLGLILIVEVARHKLDHHVEHSAFYKAVLEGVYSEREFPVVLGSVNSQVCFLSLNSSGNARYS